MPKFAANLSMLYTELPFMQRFEAAAKDGFEAVEYLFPYPFKKEELAAALKANKLKQILHNLPAGNWDDGERGIAIFADRTDEFKKGVASAIEYATALECPTLNVLVGKLPEGGDAKAARATLVENLKYAAKALKGAGIAMVIEPCNTYDIPGFFVNRSAPALAILDDVGSDNLKLQYDIYHMQRMEGELAATIEKNIARIGHMQLADNPGRNEPGTGEINYAWLFKHIDKVGYKGWIGCEYKPLTKTTEGLGWRKALAA